MISRYHRVSGYDWIAIPLLPYLYAVDRPDQVPLTVTPEDVAALRDAYRRTNLENVAPDATGGRTPAGIGSNWSARHTTGLSMPLGSRPRRSRTTSSFGDSTPAPTRATSIFCFTIARTSSRQAIDFYYPHAVHRSLIADVGIMTPKQAAKSLVSYSKRHRDLQFSSFVIPQVPGTIPRSTAGPWRAGVPGQVQKVCGAAGFRGGAAPSSWRKPGVCLAGGFALRSAPDRGTERLPVGAGG